MIIKPSTALRNDYSSISNLAHEAAEPIYITKNGDSICKHYPSSVKKTVFFIFILVLTLMLIVVLSICLHGKQEDPVLPPKSYQSFVCAKIDYRDDSVIRSKVVTGQIRHVTNIFGSLELVELNPSVDDEYLLDEEDWIFRVIFNWKEIVKGDSEVVFLVYDSHIRLGEKKYSIIGDYSLIPGILDSLFEYLASPETIQPLQD